MRSRQRGTTTRSNCRRARFVGLPEFAWFTAHLLAQLPRFRTAYNKALATYRCVHKMRNRAHPMPDLAMVDDWLEAPFWIWTADDPVRRPLFARKAGGGIEISDRNRHTIALPISQDGDPALAAEQLRELSSRGIKVRTRALTTTIFARLVLSDMFLHGIGGAKYDQVTDEIVRLFFGFEPPEFATVSATLRLPHENGNQDGVIAGQWEQRLRELQYHPEQHVNADGANGDRQSSCGVSSREAELAENAENGRECTRTAFGDRGREPRTCNHSWNRCVSKSSVSGMIRSIASGTKRS